ncbi:hypothetical protein CTheo_7502 [Ceratobasidium theobromae]|uniref:Uncharacterized protein n=1 Tax=Ceratobasidium theobromae TaxID=1582974 RepID=A0A5N5QBA0_9AGAM|nr:hypothetical protein CTheo_7502 [Ceratobasidium theobromae]
MAYASEHRLVNSRDRVNAHAGKSIVRRAKTYNMTDNYFGNKFFEGWDFFNQADPTHGNVNFLNREDAFAKGLAFVEPDGTAVMKVDDTTFLPSGGNRNSYVTSHAYIVE